MKITNEKVVFIALACNLVIFATKAVAAWITGSSAIFSETLHSFADSINSVLLLIGIRRATIPPDQKHPFGYTRAIYFWSLLGAIFMFGVIASGSMWKGYMQITHPTDISNMWFAIASLVLSIALEGIAVSFAFRGLLATSSSRKGRKKGFLSTFRGNRDPAVKLVLVEDCMSLSGAIIALIGLGAVQLIGLSSLDGYAALSIGLLLAFLAVYLINENRVKLLGESAPPEMEDEIRKHAESDPEIHNVLSLKTIQVGSNKVMVYLVVELEPETPVEELDDITYNLEKRIIREIPEVIDCFIEVVASTCEPCKEKIKKQDDWLFKDTREKN